MKNVMKKAHEITKKIIRKGDSYRATFRLALSFAHSLVKKGVNKMVELKGTEKQVKWANDIRETVVGYLNKALEMQLEKSDSKGDRKGKTVEEWRETFKARFERDLSLVINNDSAEFYIKNFKHIEKENDSFSVARALNDMQIKTTLIHYLQKR